MRVLTRIEKVPKSPYVGTRMGGTMEDVTGVWAESEVEVGG